MSTNQEFLNFCLLSSVKESSDEDLGATAQPLHIKGTEDDKKFCQETFDLFTSTD